MTKSWYIELYCTESVTCSAFTANWLAADQMSGYSSLQGPPSDFGQECEETTTIRGCMFVFEDSAVHIIDLEQWTFSKYNCEETKINVLAKINMCVRT